MGNYTFTWAHPADEVFVTGDFDDWKKTIKLEKKDGVFKKTVELPSGKHQYKFVVDGNWLTNDSHPKEEVEGKGIYNNVLKPEDFENAILSSAAPESSTAQLAAAVPKEETKKEEKTDPESLPGAYPLTPPAETPSTEPQAFSVNPIPATEGLGNPVKLAPGEPVPDPSTLTGNTVASTAKLGGESEKDAEEKVSVAPIPATAGPGNPVHLAPGEKVPDPSTLTSNTISSTVKTDAASYEKSDALPPQLGPVALTPDAEREAKGGMFALPPLTDSLIPESSLPKNADTEIEQDPGVTIQSAGPTSTTAALAGQVPLEPKVPAAVTESQKEADVPAEASANPEAVADKQEVEEELKKTVPEKPSTTEENSAADKVPANVAQSQEQANVAPEASASSAVVEEKKAVEEELKEKVGEQLPTSESLSAAENVPAAVANSQKEAHGSAEAAAVPNAVQEKKEVEQELKEKVPEQPAAVADVPIEVTMSQRKADAPAEASANPEAVDEKQAVEKELLNKIREQPAAADNSYISQAEKAAVAGATAVAGTVAAVAYSAKDKAGEALGVTKEKAADTVSATKEKAADTVSATKEKAAETVESNGQATATQVPEVVAESQKEAHASPEASANPEAVQEKKQVEGELLREVKSTDEAGEPAPTLTAELTETAPSPTSKADNAAGLDGQATAAEKSAEAPVAAVPDVVAESQKEAHASPEASADAQAVQDKKHLEKEILQEVWKTEEPGTPAPAITADLAEPTKTLATESKPTDGLNASAAQPAEPLDFKPVDGSREPTTTSQTEPTVTTGVQSSATEAKSEPKEQPATTTQTQPTVTTGVESATTEAKTEAKQEPKEQPATTTQTQPTVTTGVESGTAEAKTEAKQEPATTAQTQPTATTGAESATTEAKTTPEAPKTKDAPATGHASEASESNTAASDKKKKRQSFFSKLKAKFKDF